jgi:glycosyltransferase involved in cell wall biosynthesis
VVVVSGWSTFAAQAAIAWCRSQAVPYVLHVVSHDADPKPAWRRAVKARVVPPLVRGASSWLVVGSLARDSLVALGADPARVRVFANTIDVPAYVERFDRLACRRHELRAQLGLARDDVACLCVARLVPEKGIDTLLRAAAAAGVRPVVVGDGPERATLEALERELGSGAVFAGPLPWERVAEAYAACDLFCLLSRHEPWGVVVNEAAACALPLVLSDRVGAAHDLLREGENGRMVPAGDVEAAAAALRELAADPALRRRWGARSREIVSAWRYEESVESFLAACREALGLGADVQ